MDTWNARLSIQTAQWLVFNPQVWRQLEKKATERTLLKSYAVGEFLPCPHGSPISQMHMELWLDKPVKMQCKSLQIDKHDLLMRFDGQVAVNDAYTHAQVLVDTGATHFTSTQSLQLVLHKGLTLREPDME